MGKKVDLTGRRFGQLVVLREIPERRANKILWECRCGCGAITTPSGSALKRGLTKSCGCQGSVLQVGARFGRLTVIEVPAKGRRNVRCQCECGSVGTYRGSSIKSGDTRSCGCLQRELQSMRQKSHGMSDTPEYKAWGNMKERCYRPKHISYPHYGGKGIKVCDRWLNSFEAFYADLGPRPSINHSIDRIDPNKDYGPENCRWATPPEQQNNKTSNVLVEFKGEQLTLAEAARATDIPYDRLYKRLKQGISGDRLFAPSLEDNTAAALAEA